MLKLLTDLTGITIALYAGLRALKCMNVFYKIFFIQLVTYAIIYILSEVVQNVPNSLTVKHDNSWLYNLYLPVETAFLSWAAFQYFKHRKEKFLIWVGYGVFFTFFLSEVSIRGIRPLANHGFIAGSILLLLVYLPVLYTQFTGQNKQWIYSPEVWISLGIVLYFVGIVPYLSLIHYLQVEHPRINLILYRFIIGGLANLRYIFLAIGFWLVRRNALAKTSSQNE